MIRTMQFIHGFVGVLFVALALLHVPHPSPYVWVPFALGALLAFMTLFGTLSLVLARLLAVATTALLFFFFAGFFLEVPELEAGWYGRQEAWRMLSLLFGGFGTLSILSDFSCRCKADCRESREPQPGGFFSAPVEAPQGKS